MKTLRTAAIVTPFIYTVIGIAVNQLLGIDVYAFIWLTFAAILLGSTLAGLYFYAKETKTEVITEIVTPENDFTRMLKNTMNTIEGEYTVVQERSKTSVKLLTN